LLASTRQRGKRAVVWIAGEPGIGKTTLIEQFSRLQRSTAQQSGTVAIAKSLLRRLKPDLNALRSYSTPIWLLGSIIIVNHAPSMALALTTS